MSNHYRIVKKRRAWWPITWNGVTEEGRVVANKIEGRFWLPKVDEFVPLIANARKVQQEASDRRAAGDDQSIALLFAKVIGGVAEGKNEIGETAILTDWKGPCAENDDVLPFTLENLTLLMGEATLYDRVLTAWNEVIAGGPKDRAGN